MKYLVQPKWTIFEWLGDGLTRVMVTAEAPDSRWWRRRYLKAEVERRDIKGLDIMAVGHRQWHFVIGGDMVYDHDPQLASDLESRRKGLERQRAHEAERAKLKNPWVPVAVDLPPAKVVKR